MIGDTTYTDYTSDSNNITINATSDYADMFSSFTGSAMAMSSNEVAMPSLAESFDVTPLLTKINMSITYVGGPVITEGDTVQAIITIDTPLADEEWNNSLFCDFCNQTTNLYFTACSMASVTVKIADYELLAEYQGASSFNVTLPNNLTLGTYIPTLIYTNALTTIETVENETESTVGN